MDRYYKYFLILSILIHLVIFVLIYFYISKNRLNLKYNDSKTQVVLVKNLDRNKILSETIKQENVLTNIKNVEFYENNIKKKIKLDKKENYTEIINEYSVESTSSKHVRLKNNQKVTFDSDEFTENVEDELSRLESLPVVFLQGENRKLISSDIDKIKSLNIINSTKCKIKVIIDKDGNIINAEVVESTGNIENDHEIEEVIKQWKFGKSSANIQEALISLKYLLY